MNENNISTLRELINQIDVLCDTVKQENKEMERQIEERKEVAYSNMCADLAPYYSLYAEMYQRDDTCAFYIDLSEPINGIKVCIAFHAGEVYICRRRRHLLMQIITSDGDFKAYRKTNDYYEDYLIYPVARVWSSYASEFEKNFMSKVQTYLKKQAERINKETERLQKELAEVE